MEALVERRGRIVFVYTDNWGNYVCRSDMDRVHRYLGQFLDVCWEPSWPDLRVCQNRCWEPPWPDLKVSQKHHCVYYSQKL